MGKGKVWTAIIAGGQGTRLFPLSHEKCPKQFCHLNKTQTFIQATIKRFVDFGVKPKRIVIIVTNDNQLELAKNQCLPLGIISENILKISPDFGYAGAMFKAAEFISELDEDAIIINTPADQYIVSDESFVETINNALDSARAGNPTIIGVKIRDLVVFTGCGHALYDVPEDETELPTYSVKGFVEKPDEKTAKRLLREDNSACNTGINVWDTHTILSAVKSTVGLGTDELMALLRLYADLKVAVGTFSWYDCGTLKSLYEISAKTPNHKNATLGNGKVERTDCRGSLFYTIEGVTLRATNIKDEAVILNVIDGKFVLASVKLADSQKVKQFAEEYNEHKDLLADDFSFGARNNIIMRTDFSNELNAGFVGADNHIVYSHKNTDGDIEIAVSEQ